MLSKIKYLGGSAMEQMIVVDTIGQLHEILDYEKPLHPLITLIDVSKVESLKRYENMKIKMNFYTVALKTGVDCEIKYGRQSLDFTEGSLVFSGPGQVSEVDFDPTAENVTGWMLCFHPDLIAGSGVAKQMDHYTFFSYAANEALHLSDKEKDIITSVVDTLEVEYSMNLDIYSHKLLVSNLEVLLNYCERFYGRQFITRKKVNKDVVIAFETMLNQRFEETILEEKGIPHVKELAVSMGYSTYYLSDLLKRETGSSVQAYIHEKIILKAKDYLTGSDDRVGDIAYKLGYEHPEHFSRFFKKKIGMSPVQYRKSLKIS